MKFLHQIITDQATLLPDRPAVLRRDEDVSFAELLKNIESARKAILLNSNYGDRIAILGSNNLFYVELLYGIPSFGRICVPLNKRLSTKALINQVKELDVRIPGRQWMGSQPAKEEFEKNLIIDFCKKF